MDANGDYCPNRSPADHQPAHKSYHRPSAGPLRPSLLGSAAGLLVLMGADSNLEAIAFGVVYGSIRRAWAVVQSLVWADYFGRGFLGATRGYVSPFQLLATVLLHFVGVAQNRATSPRCGTASLILFRPQTGNPSQASCSTRERESHQREDDLTFYGATHHWPQVCATYGAFP